MTAERSPLRANAPLQTNAQAQLAHFHPGSFLLQGIGHDSSLFHRAASALALRRLACTMTNASELVARLKDDSIDAKMSKADLQSIVCGDVYITLPEPDTYVVRSKATNQQMTFTDYETLRDSLKQL